IMYYSQVVNGLLLPFVLIFMLLLINDRKIMGNYVNGPVMNILSCLTVIILISLSLVMVIASLV
ncbi:MAG: Mn transporter, partial [Syntrophobacteraceae bacterium CG23_combo_of_CG06-09_8_20_14_all_50_8]